MKKQFFKLMLLTTAAVATSLPDWLPPPGEVATLTVANSGLANNYVSQCAPYFSDYYFPRTTNTYGGCFKNPYWGTYGCALFFAGGHANHNDNSVTIAEYGQSAVTFKRVTDPTPWFGTGTDADTRYNNSGDGPGPQVYLDWTGEIGTSPLNYGINSIDSAPGASHTYGSGDFIGPEQGGATNGTYLRVWTPAINRANMKGSVAALALDFDDITANSSTRKWRKQSLNRRDENTFGGAAPVMTQIVPLQQRVYIVTNGYIVVRWFDIATGQYVTGTGTGFGYDYADGFDGGTLFHVPSRGLLVCAYRRGGVVEIQWMDVTVEQPTLGGTATLSTALAILDPWGAATWCPDNNRIIVGAVAGDSSAVHEVEIPAVLTDTWTVTRTPFGAGQSLPAMASSGEFKRFHYDEKIKAIFYFPGAKRTDQGDDTAYVYRPRSFDTTGILGNAIRPGTALSLDAAPNPFNPRTCVTVRLPRASTIHLAVYDVSGHLVKTIVQDWAGPGSHSFVWDAMDVGGNRVATGLYICRLTWGKQVMMAKVILAK